jgi:nanoRNase/pAp phosphatase (c-di-AMP/oligoRNAs hydrolase)
MALVSVNQAEINEFSALYNPSALVIPDILQVEKVGVVCFIKCYDSGRITGTLRSNYGFPVSGDIAQRLGGGGHQYAAGFKSEETSYDDIIKNIITITQEKLSNFGE